MDNQDQQNQLSPPQEIDLVDLIAVLWRRKGVIIAVSALVVVTGLFLFMPTSKSSVSTMLKIGEITETVDGNTVLRKIMSPNESKLVLEKVYLPEAIENITRGDDALFTSLSKSIVVNGAAKEDLTSSLLSIDCSVSEENVENMITIFNYATSRLLTLQNKKHKTHQDQIQNQISAKKLDLNILLDTRRVKAEKLSLNSDRFSNEQKLEKDKDEELLKQEELKHKKLVVAAENNLNAVNRTLARENAAYKRHEELIPILEERIKTLNTELSSIANARDSIYEQRGGDDSSSILLTEALRAIDNRDGRLRDQIEALNQNLTIDFPLTRVAIETRLDLLAESIMLAEDNMAIVKHNLAVFLVEKGYHTKELVASSANIDTMFEAFDASHEAAKLRLEADIATLELSLAQSTPSEIIAQSTIAPVPKRSLKLIGIGALFIGVMFGCFAAFFLELLAQAKVRVSESA
jgi:hypothetical protein